MGVSVVRSCAWGFYACGGVQAAGSTLLSASVASEAGVSAGGTAKLAASSPLV